MFEYIKLQRTMCYGTCPVYSVTVDSEGIDVLEEPIEETKRQIIK